MNEILLHHRGLISTFNSKRVTHIIRNLSLYQKKEDITLIRNFKHTRAAIMIRASLEKMSRSGVDNKFSSTAIIITPQNIERLSYDCKKCKPVARVKCMKSNSENDFIFNPKPRVRRLSGFYIKVEDMEGKYKPLIKEMKNWPQLIMSSGHGSPFDQPSIKKTLFDAR